KDHFTIGIDDDVTHTSLAYDERISSEPEGTIKCKFWGLGADGTVGANKTAIKIIGDHTDLYAQGYFAYDSKKSGGVTISHLRFGKKPIRSTYLINSADYVGCHNQSYVYQYDMLKDLKDGGTFMLNTIWSKDEIEQRLPASVKKALAAKNAKFYYMNAYKIAEEIGLGGRINMVLQAAFFKLTGVIPLDDAVKYLKDGIVAAYGKKGQKILDMNFAAVEAGVSNAIEFPVPADWANAEDAPGEKKDVPAFIEEILEPINRQDGDSVPVSKFADEYADGTFPAGTSAYEKRGVAIHIPIWKKENCIQCNQCSFVCPHAAIRPILVNDDELKDAPEGFETLQATGKGFEDLKYRIQTSPLDCLGCGNCADICPAKEKALVMTTDWDEQEIPNWTFAADVKIKDSIMNKSTVKGSQFAKPYFEFSGACAGCGETPYIKVITQLFGDRMMIANATGCSSIWGASAPSMPYCKDENGRGPSWANSLFEDNAEYGYGMAVGVNHIRDSIVAKTRELLSIEWTKPRVKEAAQAWLDHLDDGGATGRAASDAYAEALAWGAASIDETIAFAESQNDAEMIASMKGAKEAGAAYCPCPACTLCLEILAQKDYLMKKSVLALGGDGWAYDIGYGGLDHVLATGENVNVLVFDTEVYSNTGGQASKSTPEAAIAKFAASGKRVKKKDLGMMAMSYGYVYVAQVGMGADKNQFMKAILEAEAYDGPSLIICYAPCINHGIKQGMVKAQENTKDAVASGYWQLYRYNPELKKEGKNPFTLDSKEPAASFRDYIMNQVRYSSLAKEFPDVAEELFTATEEDAKERLAGYKKLAEG
ncbi:MAG: 2-oxoacid:acceptor oxidoreductase family protein, partial [Clostridiales Family XIII bacterium]|nr:2-oxoacid:acceptor oxidoreductase family protein [Clostridiales Family XIII bacterium]